MRPSFGPDDQPSDATGRYRTLLDTTGRHRRPVPARSSSSLIEACDGEVAGELPAGHDVTTVPPALVQRQGLHASVQRPSGNLHSVPKPQIKGQTVFEASAPTISSALVDSDGEEFESSTAPQPIIPTNNNDMTENTARMLTLLGSNPCPQATPGAATAYAADLLETCIAHRSRIRVANACHAPTIIDEQAQVRAARGRPRLRRTSSAWRGQSSLCGKTVTNAADPNGAKRSMDLLAGEAAFTDRVRMPNPARDAGCVPHSLMGTIMGTAPQ